MATITPSMRFMTRLIPAILVEAVVLGACVMLYVYTGNVVWIFLAAAAGVIMAVWIVVIVFRHRSEWRWYDGTPGDKT